MQSKNKSNNLKEQNDFKFKELSDKELSDVAGGVSDPAESSIMIGGLHYDLVFPWEASTCPQYQRGVSGSDLQSLQQACRNCKWHIEADSRAGGAAVADVKKKYGNLMLCIKPA
jgi:bacteriocin-like protein